MRFYDSSGGGIEVEQPMLPTQPPTTNGAPSSKRKTPEAGDAWEGPNKKSKTDPNGIAKRKLQGEKFGGLIIERGPASVSVEARKAMSASRTTQREGRTANTTSTSSALSVQTGNKPHYSRAGDSKTRAKGNKGYLQQTGEDGEDDVDEDVRQMNSEADELRDRSRASLANVSPDAPRVEFRFPAPKLSLQSGKSRVRKKQTGGPVPGTPSRAGSQDTVIPLVVRETPQIMKNKVMRGENPSAKQVIDSRSTTQTSGEVREPVASSSQPSNHRRRTSMSMRGKRISAAFEATGIIAKPHASVSDTSLFKHIDTDLPDAERVRQLLIWTTSRAMEPISTSSKGRSRRSMPNIAKATESDLPALPLGGDGLLESVIEELVRQIAEKKVDTSGHGGPLGEGSSNGWSLKENEQNIRNRTRERLFTETIEERRKEDTAWVEVGQFYETHKANVLASLHQQSRARTPLSAKAKGKQRAASSEPEDLEPWEGELSEQFRGTSGYDVAKFLLQEGVEGVSRGDPRRDELLFKEDMLRSSIDAARELVRITSAELDRRFELLSISLSQISIPSANATSSHKQSTLSTFLPITATPHARDNGPDPQALLRAISVVDATRPRSQLDDATRRAARDVQRARESAIQGGDSSRSLSERRLKDVPPPTPRKAPGTPKRPTTPGASRR